MDGDEWRWETEAEAFIPDVDEPAVPGEIGRLYGPDGSLLLILTEPRPPFGFVPT